VPFEPDRLCLIFCVLSAHMLVEAVGFAVVWVKGIASIMSDISVEVLDNGLRVTRPGTPYALTYELNPQWRMLEASELLTAPDISGQEASFAAEAWKAAYSEAKALGWL